MATHKNSIGGRVEKSQLEYAITNFAPTKNTHSEITRDHPIVQKILAYVEKEIIPETRPVVRRHKHHKYLGNLSDEELVIYAFYNRIRLVPSIYDFHITNELSESDSNKLVNIMSG